MLKIKKDKLINEINAIIKEVEHMNNIKQGIGKEFIDKNLPAHRAMNVFMGIEDLRVLSDSDNDIQFLFLFTLALKNVLKNENIDIDIDIESYFTQLEYKQWINYKADPKLDTVYPIIFGNAQQVGDGIWQTAITAKQLAELDSDNVILYNFKTQRSPKITVDEIKDVLSRIK